MWINELAKQQAKCRSLTLTGIKVLVTDVTLGTLRVLLSTATRSLASLWVQWFAVLSQPVQGSQSDAVLPAEWSRRQLSREGPD